MIRRADIRAAIEELQATAGDDDEAALRRLGFDPRGVELEARAIAAMMRKRRVPYDAAVAAAFNAAIELGFVLAQRHRGES